MRVAAVFGLVVLAVGAVLTWAIDRRIAGVEADTVGALLMVVGGIVAIFVILLAGWPAPTTETAEDSEDRLSAGWPRR